MDADPFAELEGKVGALLARVVALQSENGRLKEENERLREERAGFRARVDSILKRLEEV